LTFARIIKCLGLPKGMSYATFQDKKELKNCVRILTRIFPVLFEPQNAVLCESFFWAPQQAQQQVSKTLTPLLWIRCIHSANCCF
jgi:hypothetical protein